MNKYFSKAVFYTEKKNRLYSMIAYSSLYLWGIIDTIEKLRMVKANVLYTPPIYYDIFNSYSLITAIAVISVIYSYLEKDKKYYFMLTQPYGRDTILITKTLSYMISYTLPTIIYGLLSFIFLIFNKKYYINYNVYIGNIYGDVMSKLFLSILFTLSALTFIVILMQLLEMCFGKTPAVIIIPISLWYLFFITLSVMHSFISNKLGNLREYMNKTLSFIFNYGVIFQNMENVENKSLFLIIYESFHNFNPICSLILIALSIALFYIILRLNKKIKTENLSNIFLFKFSERIFNAIFCFTLTILGSLIVCAAVYYIISFISGRNLSTLLIIKYGLQGKENIEHTIYLILNILWIPLYILNYNLITKIVNKRRVA
ncbi:hypothetical protein M2651_00645 [Clostridium sp. SYSU_GA19001]|uniref:hypothetical protein n=1 Tax=Clostridium caldaquaticum TaxID=2940653 RepID=UPI00207706DA|nr:hypothetical protein [Clostridium caldaquaticum]MCM8709529.1 hypothetical protein [Clostridium caldaquaticum]